MTSALDAARERLVFALDVNNPVEGIDIASELRSELRWIKVATRLFTRSGPGLIGALREMNYRVFLDLKFHDIPDQVHGACRSAAELGAELITVHACGGRAMLEAAVKGAAEGSSERDGPPSRILAVTVLTSLDQSDLSDVGVNRAVEDQVVALAALAQSSGCHGVVASPKELSLLRPRFDPPFGILTPGIRPSGSAVGDQKRVTTPADAIGGGSDWLVVGRPIRNAADRPAAARAILDEMAGALHS